jgi:uncharacterized protein YukE
LYPSTPANYDSAYIAVTPANMNNAVNAIQNAANSIGDDLNAIFTCLADLRLAWSGPASHAADELTAQWMGSVTALFGSGSGSATGVVNSSPGALSTLLNAVSQIASNYALTEQSISDMFRKVYEHMLDPQPILPSPPGWHGAQPPAPTTDNGSDAPYYSTSVNET